MGEMGETEESWVPSKSESEQGKCPFVERLENNPLWLDVVVPRLTRRGWALASNPWRMEEQKLRPPPNPGQGSWWGRMLSSRTKEGLVPESP